MPDDDPMIGQLLASRYALTRVVGSGGMASVYQAWDTRLDRFVAVKIFSVGKASDDARRQSEVKLLARLNNPNLVTMHDAYLSPENSPAPSYLVMELVEGPDLGARLAQGALSGDEVAGFATELAEALATIHDAGIVHRDLKPGNILLAPTGLPSPAWHAKIGDFGIAHLIGAESVTTVGTVIGTAAYLSPEQATGAEAGPPSDVYALGLLLLETLTGQREFPGPVIEAVSAKLARDPVIPTDLPPDWATLLARMTARDPAQRPTALELAGTLREMAPTLSGWMPLASSDGDALEPTAPMLAPTKVLPAIAESPRRKPGVSPVVIVLASLLVAALIAIGITIGTLSHSPVPSPSPSAQNTGTTRPTTSTPTPVTPVVVPGPSTKPGKPPKPDKPGKPGKGNGP